MKRILTCINPALLVALCLLLAACIPATVDKLDYEDETTLPESMLGRYDYIPAPNEEVKPPMPVLFLEQGKDTYIVDLDSGKERYGGQARIFAVPGKPYSVMTFDEFTIKSKDKTERFKNAFFIVQFVDDEMLVWDLLREFSTPPWHVDKVKKFLQDNPEKFTRKTVGLRFKKTAR